MMMIMKKKKMMMKTHIKAKELLYIISCEFSVWIYWLTLLYKTLTYLVVLNKLQQDWQRGTFLLHIWKSKEKHDCVCVHKGIQACMHAYMYVCMNEWIYVYVCMSVCMYVWMYVYLYHTSGFVVMGSFVNRYTYTF